MLNSTRLSLRNAALNLVHWRDAIVWEELRPMDFPHITLHELDSRFSEGGLILRLDCSAFVTAVFWFAGCDDPNGRAFNGSGWTGTLSSNLPAHRWTDPILPGAVCVFGDGPPWSHCVVAVTHGSSAFPPLVASHGGPRDVGPVVTAWESVAAGFTMFRWLSVAGIELRPGGYPPPTKPWTIAAELGAAPVRCVFGSDPFLP